MNIIEQTPIEMYDDKNTVVEAFIHQLRNGQPMLHISNHYPAQYDWCEIEAAWEQQYPQWNQLIFGNH